MIATVKTQNGERIYNLEVKDPISGNEWEALRFSIHEVYDIFIYRSGYATRKWLVVKTTKNRENIERYDFIDEAEAWRAYHSYSMAESENDSRKWFQQ